MIKNYGNNISIVFGSEEDRDRKKRPLMAKIANNFCKKIYLTDDNPRNENPKKIRDQLSKYIKKDKKFNIGNRALAIKEAIKKFRTPGYYFDSWKRTRGTTNIQKQDILYLR